VSAADVVKEVLARWGMPPSEVAFSAIIEYAYHRGVYEGSEKIADAIRQEGAAGAAGERLSAPCYGGGGADAAEFPEGSIAMARQAGAKEKPRE
jgi:hypothetical protein